VLYCFNVCDFYLNVLMFNVMEINALQSVRLFGLWDQPRSVVSWDDLKAFGHSWRMLRTQYEFSATDLKTIQPDKAEWILRGQLTLHDLPDMLVFPINPYTDMGADIGEVWSMGWPVELQVMMGVTYGQMHTRGLTPQIMSYFNFPLSQWQALQFTQSDAEKLHEHEVQDIFSISKPELLTITQEIV